MTDLVKRLREHAPQAGVYGAHVAGVLLDQAADEIERLRAEVEALRADAEKYRWLRESDGLTIRAAAARTPEAFDAAIDAARSAK